MDEDNIKKVNTETQKKDYHLILNKNVIQSILKISSKATNNIELGGFIKLEVAATENNNKTVFISKNFRQIENASSKPEYEFAPSTKRLNKKSLKNCDAISLLHTHPDDTGPSDEDFRKAHIIILRKKSLISNVQYTNSIDAPDLIVGSRNVLTISSKPHCVYLNINDMAFPIISQPLNSVPELITDYEPDVYNAGELTLIPIKDIHEFFKTYK